MSATVTVTAVTKAEETMLPGCPGRRANPLDFEPMGVRG
jgi:hypothetical protein